MAASTLCVGIFGNWASSKDVFSSYSDTDSDELQLPNQLE